MRTNNRVLPIFEGCTIHTIRTALSRYPRRSYLEKNFWLSSPRDHGTIFSAAARALREIDEKLACGTDNV